MLSGGNMDAAIQSRRLSIDDMFRTGWSIYRGNFKNILLVILCVYIPVNLITAILPKNLFKLMHGGEWYLFYTNTLQIIEFLIGTIAMLAIATIVEKSLQGNPPGWGTALRHGLSRWGAMVQTGLVGGIIVALLSLLLIIPGIIWLVYYSFIFYVAALRNLAGKRALDYSKSLVEGQWWRVAGITLLIGFFNFVAIMVVSIPFAIISVNPFFTILPNTLANIVTAYFTVTLVVFFLNEDYLQNPVRVLAEAPSMLPQV